MAKKNYMSILILIISFSWSDLPLVTEKTSEVSIKGFLYKTEDERYFLSSDPHLKSCCVGKHRSPEILLDIAEAEITPGQVVTAQGLLCKEKEALYTMKKTSLHYPKSSSLFDLMLFVLFFLGLLASCWWSVQRKSTDHPRSRDMLDTSNGMP